MNGMKARQCAACTLIWSLKSSPASIWSQRNTVYPSERRTFLRLLALPSIVPQCTLNIISVPFSPVLSADTNALFCDGDTVGEEVV